VARLSRSDPTTASELDVASNGGTIPFTVTAAATGTGTGTPARWCGFGGADGLDAHRVDTSSRRALRLLHNRSRCCWMDHRAVDACLRYSATVTIAASMVTHRSGEEIQTVIVIQRTDHRALQRSRSA